MILSEQKGAVSSLEKIDLLEAVAFTLRDHQRLLKKSDVQHVCESVEMCFEYSDVVRCGPCAIKQAAALGVETDYRLPFAPEHYRLRRQMMGILAAAASFCSEIEHLIEHSQVEGAQSDMSTTIRGIVDQYRSYIEAETEKLKA